MPFGVGDDLFGKLRRLYQRYGNTFNVLLTDITCPTASRWPPRAAETSRLLSVHSTGDQEAADLHWLAVDTGWRGHGIGNALVRAACGFAISPRYVRMTLRTEDFRVAAIALYRGLGFREVSEDG
ncbi:GNAT family N-acetyltransferase [Nocardia sp. NPDC050713]|uniref:GNAT family N-acetyltransferase n=1 Tax=Nocardia sp. NPDC050713 TaxID=3154511 RepID=UPI0033CD9652